MQQSITVPSLSPTFSLFFSLHSSPSLSLSFHQSTVQQPTFSIPPVAVPVSNQNAGSAVGTLQFSSHGVGPALVSSSTLMEPRLLSPQQPVTLQRNSGSPGLPQRPASAGESGAGPSPVRADDWRELESFGLVGGAKSTRASYGPGLCVGRLHLIKSLVPSVVGLSPSD